MKERLKWLNERPQGQGLEISLVCQPPPDGILETLIILAEFYLEKNATGRPYVQRKRMT